MDASKIDLKLPEVCDGEEKSSPFKNRIRKNYKHIRKWARRTNSNAFRIYDRDVKGYPFAIDLYQNRFSVQFIPKKTAEEEPSPRLKSEVENALLDLFHAAPHSIHWKTRRRRQSLEQIEKIDSSKEFFTVFEYGLQFMVNLRDYLDTGLFLDHRETRRLVGAISGGKKVLNLFAYTCSFSVHASAGGALYTKSVDLSNTYTEWGRKNFELNGLPRDRNEIVREDCLKFLAKEAETKNRYDIIVIDPPTISRSKKMEKKFDVQRDHSTLIRQAMELLTVEGELFFSTNSRKFSLDKSLSALYAISEVSGRTIPEDFRNKKIHRCWRIEEL